jgi:hypothetical protein
MALNREETTARGLNATMFQTLGLPLRTRGHDVTEEAAPEPLGGTEKSVSPPRILELIWLQARLRGLPLSIGCSVSSIQIIIARDSRH